MTDTYDALQNALQAHLQANDNSPIILTDWAIVAATAGTTTDETGYAYISSNSPPHHLTGLTQALAARHQWHPPHWHDDWEDDDID